MQVGGMPRLPKALRPHDIPARFIVYIGFLLRDFQYLHFVVTLLQLSLNLMVACLCMQEVVCVQEITSPPHLWGLTEA